MKATRVTVSHRLRAALWAKRGEGIKQHQLARAAELHPSTFSQICCDIVPIQPGDPRVLRIAAVLGVPASEAFTTTKDKG